MLDKLRYFFLFLFSLVIYPLHSTITLEEQSKVFKMPGEGERKVLFKYLINDINYFVLTYF